MKLFTICHFLSRELITQVTESYVLSPYFTDSLKPLSAYLRRSSRNKWICIFNLSCYNCKVEPFKKLGMSSFSYYCHFIPHDLLNESKTSFIHPMGQMLGKFQGEAKCNVQRANKLDIRQATWGCLEKRLAWLVCVCVELYKFFKNFGY